MGPLIYRKLVMPEDENPAHRLFGGRLMQWADEAAALYAMCQMRTTSVVTLRISESLFKNPAKSGDILEFWTRNKKIGTTSLTVECNVMRKNIGTAMAEPEVPSAKNLAHSSHLILSCEFVFVRLGKNGKPVPHQMGKIDRAKSSQKKTLKV
jgi:acyl-CoA hydrolase